MSLIAKFDGNMNVIGRLLKEYRMQKQSLYDIENNKRTVKDFELFGIAHVLEIDVNDLLKDIRKKFDI